jgi:hypothetical protein
MSKAIIENVDEGLMTAAQDALFIEAVQNMLDNWQVLADLVFENITANEANRTHMADLSGWDPRVIDRFYRIGSGEMSLKMLFRTSKGDNALMKCPVAIQEEYADAPLPVFCFDEGGEPTHRLVSTADMTPEQAKQVFNNGTIRTLEQQRIEYTLENESRRRQLDIESVADAPPASTRAAITIDGVSFTYSRLLDCVKRFSSIHKQQELEEAGRDGEE